MDIIGVGFPRTGTMSTCSALDMLGYNCHHMLKLCESTFHTKLLVSHFKEGRDINWNVFFRGYRATVDAPGAFFYPEIIANFPQALVLLNVRDADSWYRSFETLLGLVREAKAFKGISTRLDNWLFVVESCLLKTFGSNFERKHCEKVYFSHIAEVKASVDRERLVIFDPRAGWPPLCERLAQPIPSEPFPRVNQGQQMLRQYLVGLWLKDGRAMKSSRKRSQRETSSPWVACVQSAVT